MRMLEESQDEDEMRMIGKSYVTMSGCLNDRKYVNEWECSVRASMNVVAEFDVLTEGGDAMRWVRWMRRVFETETTEM